MPSSLGAADLLVAAPGVLQSVRLWASFREADARAFDARDHAIRRGAAARRHHSSSPTSTARTSRSSFAQVRLRRLLSAARCAAAACGPCGRRCRLATARLSWAQVVYLEQLPADAEAEEKHDAVLLRSSHNGEVAEAARVRLPRSAILGEGKRRIRMLGSRLREGKFVVDMNQDGVSRTTARQPPLCEARQCMPTARLSTSRRP